MGIPKIIFSFSLVCCTIIGRHIFNLLNTPLGADHVSIEQDKNLTLQTNEHVCSFVKRAAATLSAHAIVAAMREEFPFLCDCRIRITAPCDCHVSYRAERPIACIGSTHCITTGGVLVPAERYCPEHRASLVSIETVLSPDSITDIQPVLSFIKDAYACIHSNYVVEYKGAHEFLLRDKENKNTVILTSAHTRFTPDLWRAIDTVFVQKNELRSSHNKNAQWVVDVRFDNQIILYETRKGGNIYG